MQLLKDRFDPEAEKRYRAAGLWKETTACEVLEENARRFPERVAIVDGRTQLTYGEYWDAVRRLATHFVRIGLSRDDVIAVQLPNWVEFAVAVNAAMLAGIPFCQFHADFRAKEVEFILSFAEANCFIFPQEFRGFAYQPMVEEMRPRLGRLRHLLSDFDLRRFLSDPSQPIDDAALDARRPKGDDLCRVAFTSGTTGDPKAVQHTYNTTLSACYICNRNQLFDAGGATLIFLPVGLNWGLMLVLEAILAGGKAVLMERFEAGDAMRLIEREKITHFASAPAGVIALLDHPDLGKYDLSSLKAYVVGGASCPIEVIRRAQRDIPGRLVEMYGMLETGSQAQTLLGDDPERVVGLVGRPVPEVPLRILDENERDVPAGTSGEIANVGPSVTPGYYNNPSANERAFTKDGWFKTGDLGVLDADGFLKIVGRKKEMIIRGGANIYPREIEEVLFRHPAVADCAVVGLPHPRTGEQVVACVVLRPGASFTFEDMTAFLAPQIAKYKVPERLELIEALPRTPTGKVQKGRLQEAIAPVGAAR
ncbi:MAG: AMP-binding protein [Candidatus Eremiobacteraeota bacterium]|nr:AMP-binding protein [Candidatus Eremiobacteraeota bacterium]